MTQFYLCYRMRDVDSACNRIAVPADSAVIHSSPVRVSGDPCATPDPIQATRGSLAHSVKLRQGSLDLQVVGVAVDALTAFRWVEKGTEQP